MKNLIRQIIEEENKRILNESGIRDINKLAKRYQMAKIYFHQDLDGVTTALAMKNYLENNGIKVVDAEIIQYGGKEFAIHKPELEDEARGEIMPVLVDFAHGKPMFVIHTDHHDSQAGVEKDTATNFKSSRSNVETISQSISPTDIFSQDDIETISMVDSADFAKHNITPEQVLQYLFKIDRTKGVKENKKMMGLVANKLLLAFKNKPGFLTKLVMNSKPSLQSILLNIKDIMEKESYASIDQLQQNQQSYIQSRKEKGVTYEDGIISQYGLGPTMKSGGYDRYTPFINYPDADFLVTGLPMGMVQASCNPYKKERALKGVDLGEIKNEVLEKFRPELEKQRVTFGTLKRISEMDTDSTSVGFTFKDFLAIYGNSPSLTINGSERLEKYLDYMSKKLFKSILPEDRKVFNKASVNGYDVIVANSGGHKCITNISGINYLYSNAKFQEPEQRVRNSYVDLLKDIQSKFVETLKQKIEESKVTNENFVKLKKKLIENLSTIRLKKLISEEEKKAWSKGVFENGDGVNTPKITIDKTDNFFKATYEGPESGFNVESAVINPNDSIHQLSNVFTYEVNKHIRDLYKKGVYLKPVMEDIKMVKKPKYFSIEIDFEKTDKENSINTINRRGGMGHPATKGLSEMQTKCKKYKGCEKVYTIKDGSITEHFAAYNQNEEKSENEDEIENSNNIENLLEDLENISKEGKKFEIQEKPYQYQKEVELIQTALQLLGFSLPEWGVDGKFGPETKKAVMNFQEKFSTEPDGIVDSDVLDDLSIELEEKSFDEEDLSGVQKNQTKKLDIETDNDNLGENIVIGDSQSPYVANGSSKFDLISPKGSESSLWLGGKTLSWLLDAVKKHPGSSKVKNIAICIGTNGMYSTNDDVSGLVEELENKFPNANLFAVQGSWNWGGLKKVTEDKVRKYYSKFKNLGVKIIEPPIGPIEPHGNKPVYKKIGSSLDSKI